MKKLKLEGLIEELQERVNKYYEKPAEKSWELNKEELEKIGKATSKIVTKTLNTKKGKHEITVEDIEI